MLHEIHHRVKNNLQIASLLLNMQAYYAGEAATVAALRDSERRIATMAMIHEQFVQYEQSEDTGVCGPRVQARAEATCCHSIKCAYRSNSDLSPVDLAIHQAIPCALILNELLTNALKYAYPNGEEGQIAVHLRPLENRVTLTVSDHGAGLPPHVDPHRPKTLGLEIVQVLTCQLGGKLTIFGPPGTAFSLCFQRQNQEEEAENFLSKAAAGG